MMTPGPKEPDTEQLQFFNALHVDDLVELYKHGILVPTPSCPSGEFVTQIVAARQLIMHDAGRRVRVALVGIICNHPAMCKMCGFMDKSHKQSPCPKCHATADNMFDNEWMTGSKYLVHQLFNHRT